MSEFTVKISGKQAGEEVSPQHAPLKELKEALEALHKLIRETSEQAEQTSIGFRSGSLAVVASLPLDTAVYLSEVTQVKRPKADEPYMAFIQALEASSRRSGLDFTVLRDDVQTAVITPREGANLRAIEPRWVRTTLTFTGQVLSMGGRKPNIHVISEHTGDTYILSIDAKTIQQFQLYHRYVFDVQAEQAFEDPGKLRNFKYRAHLPISARMSLEELIRREGPKWAEVSDPDAWVAKLRGTRDLH